VERKGVFYFSVMDNRVYGRRVVVSFWLLFAFPFFLSLSTSRI
jgi:hypothetical protein